MIRISMCFARCETGGRRVQDAIADVGAVPMILGLCSSDAAEVQAEAADVIKVLARSPRCAAVLRACDAAAVLEVRPPRCTRVRAAGSLLSSRSSVRSACRTWRRTASIKRHARARSRRCSGCQRRPPPRRTRTWRAPPPPMRHWRRSAARRRSWRARYTATMRRRCSRPPCARWLRWPSSTPPPPRAPPP